MNICILFQSVQETNVPKPAIHSRTNSHLHWCFHQNCEKKFIFLRSFQRCENSCLIVRCWVDKHHWFWSEQVVSPLVCDEDNQLDNRRSILTSVWLLWPGFWSVNTILARRVMSPSARLLKSQHLWRNRTNGGDSLTAETLNRSNASDSPVGPEALERRTVGLRHV